MSQVFRPKKPLPRGLTLLELIVAIGLFAILTLAVTRIYLRVVDVQQKINEEQNLEGDLRYAINILTSEAQASQINTGAVTGCVSCVDTSCNGKFFCTNSTKDRLCLIDKSNNCVQYYLTSEQLIVQRGSATQYAITSKDIAINQLVFEVGSQGNYVVVKTSLKSKEVKPQNLVYQTTISNNNLQ